MTLDSAEPEQPESLGKITTAAVGGQSALAVLLVAFGPALLGATRSRLIVPATLLIGCGMVPAPLLYWARLARGSPRNFVPRASLALFVYMELLVSALIGSEVWLGLESKKDALSSDLPFLTINIALLAGILYLVLRGVYGAKEKK